MDLGLFRMAKLMEALGHPERDVPVIHVAGTNGKGSTCIFLASILREAGLHTGLYQSPAVFDPMEIIQVDGKNISEEEYRSLYKEIALIGKGIAENERIACPTIFEVQTAMAFAFFSRSGCDAAVIETGLGGDLDATNISEAAIGTVFTPISLDHTGILGDTLAQIALHKSGIMRQNVPVFSAKQQPEAAGVLAERAGQLECELYTAGPPVHEHLEKDGSCIVTFQGLPACRLGLPGSYQRDNASLAVTVLQTLRARGNLLLSGISEAVWKQAVFRGLERAVFPGRMEWIGHEPDVLLDGAHNPGAALRLREAVEKLYPDIPRIFIMGAFSDKNFMEVARIVIEKEICVLAVQAPGPRAERAESLLKKLGQITPLAKAAFRTVPEALDAAMHEAWNYKYDNGVMPVIVCFGSLSWLAEAKKAYGRLAGKEHVGCEKEAAPENENLEGI